MPASTSGTKSPFCINTNFSIFIILRPRPRTYASTSPLLLLQLHQQQQLLSIINIINSTNNHLQHAKLRILLQHLTSHAAYERSGGPPKRPTAKRPCMFYCNLLRSHQSFKVSIGLDETSCPSRGGSPGIHTTLSALSA